MYNNDELFARISARDLCIFGFPNFVILRNVDSICKH